MGFRFRFSLTCRGSRFTHSSQVDESSWLLRVCHLDATDASMPLFCLQNVLQPAGLTHVYALKVGWNEFDIFKLEEPDGLLTARVVAPRPDLDDVSIVIIAQIFDVLGPEVRCEAFRDELGV